MKTLNEFKKLTRRKMIVYLIESMVIQGWDIEHVVFGFRSYTKRDLYINYELMFNYNKKRS